VIAAAAIRPAGHPLPARAAGLPRPPWAVLGALLLAVLLAHAATLWWARAAMQSSGFARLDKPMYGALLPRETPPAAGVAALPPPPAPAKRQAVVATGAEPAAAAAAPEPAASQPQPAMTPPPGDAKAEAQAEASAPAASAAVAAVAAASSAPPPAELAQPPVVELPTAPIRPAGANTASGSAGGQGFWPPSSKVSFVATGHFRGPIAEMSGHFEWINQDGRYQLFLRVDTPVRVTEFRSQGLANGAWLQPQRYEEQGGRGVVAVNFQHERGKLSFSAITDVLDLPPGVQDTASVMMQLAGIVGSAGAALQPGASFSFPIARPRGLRQWTFTATALETIDTPLGRLAAWHMTMPAAHSAGEMWIEIWLSPQLQGLPVRIRVNNKGRQSYDDAWLEVNVVKAEQAAR
jgi:hypothetical protein